MTEAELEIIYLTIWIVVTIIGCAITWYKSAVLLAQGQDSFYVSQQSLRGYIMSTLWPFALIGSIIFLPFIVLGKLSDYLRDKLVERLKQK